MQHDASYRASLGENSYEAYRRYWCEGAVVPRYLQVVRKAAIKRGRAEVVAMLDEER